MKVLHVQKVKGVGGSERHLLSLLPALAGKGVDVSVCALATGDAHLFIGALEELGVPVVAIPVHGDLDPVLYVRLLRHVRAASPALVHTHLIHADVYALQVAHRLGIPGVNTVHGVHQLRHAFFRRLEGRAARSAKRTIAISDFVARVLDEGHVAPRASTTVVPYGIDVGAWELSAADVESARARYNVRPGEVAVGIAARLIEGKGHVDLLRALSIALRTQPLLRLLVAGEGPLRTKLEETAREPTLDGRVTFLGRVDDVRSFMHACDVIAVPTSPTLGEGFGLAALEGMAAARPLIATRVGSLPELVEDGRTGFLVAPERVDDLAAAMSRFAADPALRETLGAAGRERARSHFELSAMVEGTLDVYRSVLDGAPAPFRS